MKIPQRLTPEYYDMTVKEVLDDMTNFLLTKNIKETTGGVKSEVYRHLISNYPVDSSHGGVHYGLWYHIPNGQSFKFSPSSKKTGKLIKVSKLKKSNEMEFTTLKFVNTYKQVLLTDKIDKLIYKDKRYDFIKKLMENPMDKTYVFKQCVEEYYGKSIEPWDGEKMISDYVGVINKDDWNESYYFEKFLGLLYGVDTNFNHIISKSNFCSSGDYDPIPQGHEGRKLKDLVNDFFLTKEEYDDYRDRFAKAQAKHWRVNKIPEGERYKIKKID